MTQPLYWLTLTILMTALFWVVYILNAMVVRGIMGALANPSPDQKPLSPWAQRAKAAHSNAIENLVIFGLLILIAHAVGLTDGLITTAAMLYFVARLAHFVVYTAGIPVLRTLAFVVGWAAQIMVILALLGAV